MDGMGENSIVPQQTIRVVHACVSRPLVLRGLRVWRQDVRGEERLCEDHLGLVL